MRSVLRYLARQAWTAAEYFMPGFAAAVLDFGDEVEDAALEHEGLGRALERLAYLGE